MKIYIYNISIYPRHSIGTGTFTYIGVVEKGSMCVDMPYIECLGIDIRCHKYHAMNVQERHPLFDAVL